MIKYDLCCELGHRFQGWFRDEDAFVRQQIIGLLICPVCECGEVKQLPSAIRIPAEQDYLEYGEYSEEFQRTESLLREINACLEQNIDLNTVFSPGHDTEHHSGTLQTEGIAAISVPFDLGIDKNKLN
jgi:hypothetical protein